MLAPPPEDSRSRDLGALEGDKKARYLKSLGKLVGFIRRLEKGFLEFSSVDLHWNNILSKKHRLIMIKKKKFLALD